MGMPRGIRLLAIEKLPNGVKVLVSQCNSHEAFKQLPEMVNFEGTLFGKSGWNSDKEIAYYRTDARVAWATCIVCHMPVTGPGNFCSKSCKDDHEHMGRLARGQYICTAPNFCDGTDDDCGGCNFSRQRN